MKDKYDIVNRVDTIVKEQGSIENAIVYMENELEECESMWSMFSSDCLGHAITFYRLALQHAKEIA